MRFFNVWGESVEAQSASLEDGAKRLQFRVYRQGIPEYIRDNKQTLLRQRIPIGTCGRGIG